MRCGCYIRVSSEEQANFGYSLEAQRHLCEEYAKEHDMRIVGVYADEGVSASKALTKRKALLRMVADAEAGLLDVIIFKDFTRWSRNASQFYRIQDRLDACGVGWIAIQQKWLETISPTGKFQVSIVLGASQLESDQVGERVKFVQDSQVRKGFYPFGAQAVPYGYQMQKVDGGFKLVPHPAQAQVVKEVYAYFLTCANITDTGEQFSLKYTHTKHILENRIYLGEFRGVQGFCEPLISQDDFDTAQRIKVHKAHKPLSKRGTYAFSGVGRCWCGNCMTAFSTDKRVYYRCKNNHGCISEKKLEDAVLAEVERYLGEEDIAVTAKAHRSDNDRKKLTAKLERLNDLYIDGNISKEKYLQKRASLEAQISAIVEERKPLSATFKGGWKEGYRLLDSVQKNTLWKATLHHYEMNKDKSITLFFA